MSYRLQGPYPLALDAVGSSLRAALSHSPGAPDRGVKQRVEGLYLLWTTDPAPALVGVWLAFGADYAEHGTPGAPSVVPPYAREVLNALTEAVWWRTLTVSPLDGGTWSPLVVLEWLPALAIRSSLPPPGLGSADGFDPQAGIFETGDWLVPSEFTPISADNSDEIEASAHLPERRSLLAVVRGELRLRGATHRGRFELLDPFALGSEGGAGGGRGPSSGATGWSTWLGRALTRGQLLSAHDKQVLGPPLLLPGSSVGFPIGGWLTRDLGVWPERPADVQPEDLQPRDVVARWLHQSSLALRLTVAVFAIAMSLAVSVHLAARPEPRVAPSLAQPEAQPALSVCSSDHQAFVDELRCQLRHFAAGGSVDEAACGDWGRSSTRSETLFRENLQGAWCGLRDRALDTWVADDEVPYAELASSRACFNVLGHPLRYSVVEEGGGRLADPDLFLTDANLAVQPLRSVVDELDEVCDHYRPQLDHHVKGAVLATFVGSSPDETAPVVVSSRALSADAESSEQAGLQRALGEAERLRATLVESAVQGLRRSDATCFRAGASQGIDYAPDFDSLCEGPEPVRPPPLPKIWLALGGNRTADADDIVASYARSRFPETRPADLPTPAQWRCHLALASGRGTGDDLPTRWDLPIPVPRRYDRDGAGVRSQLQLDLALQAFDEGTDGGPCWGVVQRTIARYEPVHPLLGEPDDAGWPSAEQQLCGQICAARYRVQNASAQARWVTPASDLALCLDSSPPGDEPVLGESSLDRLALPWNGAPWISPDPAALCSFHLISQGYLPDEVLMDGATGLSWAGETAVGSGIAGGPDGFATIGARNLTGYGRARSVSSCGQAAAQCLVQGALALTGDPRVETHQWSVRWAGWVRDLPGRDASAWPWCEAIQPYLPREGTRDEGELDYPCSLGVEQVRRAVADAVVELASRQGGAR